MRRDGMKSRNAVARRFVCSSSNRPPDLNHHPPSVVHLHRSARFHSTFSLCYFKWNSTDVRILLKPSFSPSSTTFPPFSPPSLPSFFLVCIPSFPLLAPHPLPLYRTFFATLSVRFGILTGNGDLRNLRLNNFRLF